MRPRFAVVVFLLGSTLSALDAPAASLAWERQEVTVTVPPGQPELKVDLAFRNSGAQEVTILSIDTGCGCTTALPDKKTYQPGQRGHLLVNFTVGERTGPQDISILVTTNEPNAAPTQLQLHANILAFAAAAPRLLVWPVGATEEKSATLSALTPHGLTLKAAHSALPGLAVRIETVTAGREYRVFLRPPAGVERSSAVVQLDVEIPDVGPRVFYIYVAFQ